MHSLFILCSKKSKYITSKRFAIFRIYVGSTFVSTKSIKLCTIQNVTFFIIVKKYFRNFICKKRRMGIVRFLRFTQTFFHIMQIDSSHTHNLHMFNASEDVAGEVYV